MRSGPAGSLQELRAPDKAERRRLIADLEFGHRGAGVVFSSRRVAVRLAGRLIHQYVPWPCPIELGQRKRENLNGCLLYTSDAADE